MAEFQKNVFSKAGSRQARFGSLTTQFIYPWQLMFL
jgi:hypothetical protein